MKSHFNRIHANRILYGLTKSTTSSLIDSLGIGKFGFSSSCNINVICPAGNSFSNERKAICLIETNDGAFATGALVNNACNLNTPYVLTALHNTTGRNPNNFTYVFKWWSSTCTPNTNNSQALLFNGAHLRATYEPTDMALLELFQTPSISSDLSYLGWSRSTNAPSSSVGIHHPSGDQMKISFANNLATIGNIGIYQNNAWRVLWNSGIVEAGSSGSPLLDPFKRVIGQLSTLTQPIGPPCNQLIGGTNYGRFDLSWDGGGTNSTRLSNWLDPSNSGVLTTNTTNIANLIESNLSLSINGSTNYFCNIGDNLTFNITGLPTNIPITWSLSDNTVASIVGSNTSPTVTISKSAITNGYVNLIATATSCPSNFVVSKKITLGTGNTTVFFSQLTSGCAIPNKPYFWGAVEDFQGVTNYQWYSKDMSNPNNPFVLRQENLGPTADFPLLKNRYYTIRVKAITPCGIVSSIDGEGLIYASSCINGVARISITPNPAKDEIKISAKNDIDITTISKNDVFTAIEIRNKVGLLLLKKKLNKATNTTTVNVSQLKADAYVLSVWNGKEWLSEEFIKN
jgi:lysyl endopeptidase